MYLRSLLHHTSLGAVVNRHAHDNDESTTLHGELIGDIQPPIVHYMKFWSEANSMVAELQQMLLKKFYFNIFSGWLALCSLDFISMFI